MSTTSALVEELGGTQKKVYFYIKSFAEEYGYPPSVREIGLALGIRSTSTIHGHITRLEKKGLIRRDPVKKRAICVIDDEMEARQKAMTLPVFGRVAAGQPIFANENIEEYLPLPASFVRDEASFVLSIAGQSMVDAGIHDGDFVVVRKQNYADDGDIVVALIDDEATVKRFYKEKRRIRLQPENTTMEPMYFDSVDILGKVTGLFRRIR